MMDDTTQRPAESPAPAHDAPAPQQPASPAPVITAPSADALIRMRRIATGLLVFMTLVFIISHIWAPPGFAGAWGYIRAFAEASMVGALADWFAVTAIFRRPLGLPIPHTAVIPRSQDRIADAVGRFITDNFLQPDQVRDRLSDKDLCEALGKWLADPEQARAAAKGAVSAIPGVLDTLDDETVAAFLRDRAGEAAEAINIAPAIGSVIDALAQQERHHDILDALLEEGVYLLGQNEHLIREKISGRSGWLMRTINVDKRAADALVDSLYAELHAATHDRHHPLRLRINELAEKFAYDLKHDPKMQKKVEEWIRDAATHPAVAGAFHGGWSHAKQAMRADAESENSQMAVWLTDAFQSLGESLLSESQVREALNARIRSLLVALAERHGEDVANFVSETINGWEAETIVEKLETNVGRDLQYIRINGTVIGGLIGLILHAGSEFLG